MIIEGEYYAKKIWQKPIDYVQSPFRYPGGKFYALKYIIPIIDSYDHDMYVEPFLGGGSVFFGKRKAPINWLNDLDQDIIETYKAIQDNERKSKLISRVEIEVASRERHLEVNKMVPITLDEIAFKTYYLNRTSYSGIIHKPAWGYAKGASSPPENWGKFLNNANGKLKDVILLSEDYETILKRIPKERRTLVYLDPPYYLADQKRAYRKSFVEKDHYRLLESIKNLDCAFVLSYDDCEQIRRLYNWAFIYKRNWFYNTGNSNGPRPIGKELIITNFQVNHENQPELFTL